MVIYHPNTHQALGVINDCKKGPGHTIPSPDSQACTLAMKKKKREPLEEEKVIPSNNEALNAFSFHLLLLGKRKGLVEAEPMASKRKDPST